MDEVAEAWELPWEDMLISVRFDDSWNNTKAIQHKMCFPFRTAN